MQKIEKRRFKRATADFPMVVEVDAYKGRKWVAKAIDISVDGICIRSRRALPINTPFVLHFPFEWGPTFAIARVMRKEADDYGCQFLNPHPHLYAAIEKAIHNFKLLKDPKALFTLWKRL
jgi:hypothetical protein